MLRSKEMLAILIVLLLIVIWVLLGYFLHMNLTLLLAGIIVLMVVLTVVMLVAKSGPQKRAASLEKSIKLQAEEQVQNVKPEKRAEIEQVKQRLLSAIDFLKKSRLADGRSGSNALYVLPWYMVIGPSEAGKTTTILNSGLEFPLGEIPGVAGTRNCDWFFSNVAIFVDTAGRYVSEEESKEEWLAFLDMLRQNRKRKPLNGVFVVVSLADLLTADPRGIEDRARTIRRRIDELIIRLQVRFPVYLLFSKTDLLNGFVEFFEDLSRRQEEQIWGYTFPADAEETASLRNVLEEQFQALVEVLVKLRTSRLINPMKREDRRKVYLFPQEFAAIKESLIAFITKLFQHNPYQESPIFRGFYFISGTQKGSPLQRVINALAEQFSLPPAPAEQASSERTIRAFFIKELFEKVVVQEHELAGLTRAAKSRESWLRRGLVFGGLGIMALVTLLTFSAYNNQTQRLQSVYQAAVKVNGIRWDASASLRKSMTAMEEMRLALSATEQRAHGLSFTSLGLRRDDEVLPSLEKQYMHNVKGFVNNYLYQSFERSLRSFSQGADLPRETVFNYFHAYLLLGSKVALLNGETRQNEASFLMEQMNRSLDEQFFNNHIMQESDVLELRPLAQRQVQRFIAILGRMPQEAFANDVQLIKSIGSKIVQRPSIDITYTNIKQKASFRYKPFSLEDRLPQCVEYFDVLGSVPGFLTINEWNENVQKEIDAESANPTKDIQIFGIEADQLPQEMRDPKVLKEGLENCYFRDYIDTWQQYLSGLQYGAFSDLAAASRQLRKLSSVQDSPLLKFLKEACRQTTFDDMGFIRDNLTKAKMAKPGGKAVSAELAEAVSNRHPVDRAFKTLHDIVGASDQENAGDKLLAVFRHYAAISAELDGLAQDQSRSLEYVAKVLDQSGGAIPSALMDIRATLGDLDPTWRKDWFEEPIRKAWVTVLNAAQRQLDERWQMQLYAPFQRTLAVYYPFKATGPDIPLVEFQTFFQPQSGVVALFLSNELKSFLRSDLTPKQFDGLGLSMSAEAQKMLQRSKIIGNSIFKDVAMQLKFKLLPQLPEYINTNTKVEQVNLTIDGKEIRYSMGSTSWKDFEWPGAGVPGAGLSLYSQQAGIKPKKFDGVWGWFRLLESAAIIPVTLSEMQIRWDFPIKGQQKVVVSFRLRTESLTSPFNDKTFFSFSVPPRMGN